MKTKDHKKFLYWQNRYRKLGAVQAHVTLKIEKKWAEMNYAEKADILRTFVLVVTGKIKSEVITDEEM